MTHRTTRMLAACPRVSASMRNNDLDPQRFGILRFTEAADGATERFRRIQGRTWTRKKGATPTSVIASPANQSSAADQYWPREMVWSNARLKTPTIVEPIAAASVTTVYQITSRR